jgi:hypothetical protein
MRLLSRIGHHFRSLFRKERLDEELSEELRFHVERQVNENIAAGMMPEDARRAALRELGGVEQIAEECRDMRQTQWLETLRQDIRFGIRTFRRRPGFTSCVLAILAAGVGSTTVVFSIVNGVLLTALPYRTPENLVRIFGTWERGSREGVSPPDFVDYRERNTSFESVAAASNSTPLLNLKAVGDPEQVRSRNVTAGFFSTLGIQPLLGREFRREDETWKGPAVAILSYGLWQREYGGNPAIRRRTSHYQWRAVHRGWRVATVFQFSRSHRYIHSGPIQSSSGDEKRSDSHHGRKAEGRLGSSTRANRVGPDWPPIAEGSLTIRSRLVRYGSAAHR